MDDDIGPQIDETGWERMYVEAVMQQLDMRKAPSMEPAELREVVRQLLASFGPTDYEVAQISNAVTAKLRDWVSPANSPSPQTRAERLYRRGSPLTHP